MLYRIFIGLVILACGYLAYDSTRAAMALSSAQSVENGYVIQPENADTDVTVVSYMDYGCEGCRRLHPLLMKAIQDDGHIKLIPRPIVPKGPADPSSGAARLVYAAAEQGKFQEAHDALLEEYRVIDSSFISNFALEHGLDSVKLEEDMNKPEVEEQIQSNFDSLTALKGEVLPTLLINGKLIVHVNGPLPSSSLIADLFATARTL
jgi:protein-disulfide isomerase